MAMASEGSVTCWIQEIKAGDEVAAEELWNRYYQRLVHLCRKKLASVRREMVSFRYFTAE